MKKSIALFAALAAGVLIAAFMPRVPETVRDAIAAAGFGSLVSASSEAASAKPAAKGGHAHGSEEKEGPKGVVQMTADRVSAAKIEVAAAAKGVLARRVSVPGVIAADSDKVANVAARVVGTTAELNKRLGDQVTKGETIAILDSREVAEAKSELLSALVNQELQATLFEREQSLWDKKISAEQQYLKARNVNAEAGLRVDLARRKLAALGVLDGEVTTLTRSAARRSVAAEAEASARSGLQRYELRAPISGRIVERRVDLGAPVGGEGQEKVVYVIADLSSVWVELAIPTGDLSQIREGQSVKVTTSGDMPQAGSGRIVFISPMLNQETRSARVIASLDNKDFAWRPGTFVTAAVTIEEQQVDIRVPRSALQTIGADQVVFVRTAAGFEKRDVVLGKGDDAFVEVVFGLDPDEPIAVANSFILKAELGKAEAEHSH
jgi:cobalt-zinc-cadmium efflux system membrane fusion protein